LAAEQQLAAQQANLSQGNIAEQGVNSNLFGTAAGAQNAQNTGAIQNFNNAQTINAATAQNNTNAVNTNVGSLIGGGGNGLASIGAALFSQGGPVKKYADGGDASDTTGGQNNPYSSNNNQNNNSDDSQSIAPQKSPYVASNGTNVTVDPGGGILSGIQKGPLSKIGQMLKGKGSGGGSSNTSSYSSNYGNTGGAGATTMAGGPMDNPGDIGSAAAIDIAAKGGKIKALNPSEKAVKKDNSYSNDKVPALLSEGEIVIPRSITNHKMAPEKAAQFVAKALAKRKMVKS